MEGFEFREREKCEYCCLFVGLGLGEEEGVSLLHDVQIPVRWAPQIISSVL